MANVAYALCSATILRWNWRTFLSDSEALPAASTTTIVAAFLIVAIRLADTHAIHTVGVYTRAATSTTTIITALLT